MSAPDPTHTSPLARQQAALLAALFERHPDAAINTIADYVCATRANGQFDPSIPPVAAATPPSHRGFLVYRANGHELAARALAAAFPVLAQMLGDDNFAALARAFWHAQPPVRGDIAQWGEGLPGFVAASAQLQEEPSLPDVARIEWALHTAAGAADETADLASFGLLASTDPALVKLRLCASARVFESPWPVVSLIQAHQMPNEPGRSLAEAARLLHQRVPQSAVAWRQGLRPTLRETMAGEVALLTELQAGASLSEAVDAAGALDFQAWLPMAVQTGLLLGAQV